MTPWAPRPGLRLIPGALESASGWSWFCSRCAAPAHYEPVSPVARMCPSCGMGLLLETRSSAAPVGDDAFLVVNSQLAVQAISRQAQALLGLSGAEVIGRPLARLLGAADAEASGPGDLEALLEAVSSGSDEVRSVCVRPRGAFGVRLTAQIAPCGPPRAALVVLASTAPRPILRVL